MATVVIIGGAVLVLVVAGVWYAKRRLERMGQHLPGAIEQWEKEIEKLENPKASLFRLSRLFSPSVILSEAKNRTILRPDSIGAQDDK